jgi:hypothetical protein
VGVRGLDNVFSSPTMRKYLDAPREDRKRQAMTDNRSNIIAFMAIVMAAALVAGFLAALMGAHSGEAAGALGSVVGGIIGALGSAGAVYIMLKGQREDEIEKVSAAVLREIAKLCESPIGQLGACAKIQSGEMKCPTSDLKTMFQTPTPVVFPAVASLIGRLPCPTLVVSFYIQLQETSGLLSVLEHGAPPDEILTGGHIQGLADLLIRQCQLARSILSSAELAPDREAALVAGQRADILKVLDEQLAAAKQEFPDAESFHAQRSLMPFDEAKAKRKGGSKEGG